MQEELNMDAIKTEYNKLVGLYSQIEEINAEIKEIKESIKLEGCNPALVSKIAKAFVANKKDKLANESQEVIDLAEALS